MRAVNSMAEESISHFPMTCYVYPLDQALTLQSEENAFTTFHHPTFFHHLHQVPLKELFKSLNHSKNHQLTTPISLVQTGQPQAFTASFHLFMRQRLIM